jgi:hypothetical protein
MKHDGVGRTLAWMAGGAAVLVAGAFLGASAGRRRDGRRAPDSGRADLERLDDLEDRPVARAAWADALAAARRVDEVAHAVTALESRVSAAEVSARRVDEVWERVLRIEQMLADLKRETAEPVEVQAVVAEAERRVMPRVTALENRLHQHDAAIHHLQTHAANTDLNLQRMIAAVEKLTEQISRALPAGPQKIEPRRETAGAQEPTEEEGRGGEERGGLTRWRAAALIGAVTLGLAGSYAAGLQVQRPRAAAAATVSAGAPAEWPLQTAIRSLTALVEGDPGNRNWRYELGRLNELKGDRTEAGRWYRSVLSLDPHDQRAITALATLDASTAGSR